METLNIFVGTVAIKWSLELDCNKILIGDSFDKTIADIDYIKKPKFLLFDEVPNKSYCSAQYIEEYWNEYYKELYRKKILFEYNTERNKNVDLVTEITKNKTKKVNIITASGGLFSAVIVPVLLKYLKRKVIDVKLIVQPPKYGIKATLKSYFLTDFIKNKHYNLPIELINIENESNSKGRFNSLELIQILDKKAIHIIKQSSHE